MAQQYSNLPGHSSRKPQKNQKSQLGADAKEVLSTKIINNQPKFFKEACVQYNSHRLWVLFSRMWYTVTPLETWGVYLDQVDSEWGQAFEYCKIINCQASTDFDIRRKWPIANNYAQFLVSHKNLPLLADNHRVFVSLGSLSFPEFRQWFPLASRTTGRSLGMFFGVLFNIFFDQAAMQPPPFFPFSPPGLNIPNISIRPTNYLATAIFNIINISLWHLYRTNAIAKIAGFLIVAMRAAIDGNRPVIDMVLSHMDQLDERLPLCKIPLFKESQVHYLRVIANYRLESALKFMKSIWGDIEDVPLDTNSSTAFIDQNYQWLTPEGDLHQMVPSGALESDNMVLARVKVGGPLDRQLKEFQFTRHLVDAQIYVQNNQMHPETEPEPVLILPVLGGQNTQELL
ncbi:hypothetical protein BJ085DRAFT_28246 [Dimargaris cristalligena]|uniref:Uncharacterized protein n=1 Tax=Dimargaris cristalligena TaxID=215637 RepID=A0A4P9ZPU1_9FUNG|nr:hypothetical protein BJ085DRAFT_28246 [Dimargaris cristalligena]|eukprot:RKP35464.1 hypothetical protein BJ085DRAFT_28246 [Dimargaris cristalligena]